MKLYVSLVRLAFASVTSSAIVLAHNKHYKKRHCFAWKYTPTDDVEKNTIELNRKYVSKYQSGNSSKSKLIVLIRSAHYDKNGYLDALGEDQAAKLGGLLKKLKDNKMIPSLTRNRRIFCSTSKNASATCEIAMKEAVDGFYNTVDCEQLIIFKEDLAEGPLHKFSPPIAGYSPHKGDIKICQEKINKFFIEIANDNTFDLELVFCHTSAIGYLFCKFMQLPLDAYLRFTPRHCGLTILECRGDGRVSCHVFNDTGYLLPEEQTA